MLVIRWDLALIVYIWFTSNPLTISSDSCIYQGAPSSPGQKGDDVFMLESGERGSGFLGKWGLDRSRC